MAASVTNLHLSGTDVKDTLAGAAGDDFLSGGGDEDLLSGGDGNDTLDGGLGNDILLAGNGLDSLSGGEGDDALYSRTTDMADGSDDGANAMDGGAGDDSLYGGNGRDTLTGGVGNDYITKFASAGNSTLLGGEGEDSLFGGTGNDSLDGGAGDDPRLEGYAGDDTVLGGTGNDKLWGHEGKDSLDGGDGHDYLSGEDGNDALDGGSGNDTLVAGNGLDSLSGGDGDDVFYARTTDLADGSDDGANAMDGGAGDDSLYGGNGRDTLTGGLGNDYLTKFASAGNSTLLGGEGEDSLFGGTGNDSLDGGAGDDPRLEGYAGDDTVLGGAGNDTLWGGDGNDSLDGGEGIDELSGGDGNDALDGGSGNDTLLAGNGLDSLSGGDGNDALYARTTDMDDGSDDGANAMDGGAGDDSLYGGTGRDTLTGGLGDDYLTKSANAGDSTLLGGEGTDSLLGGLGNDSLDGGDGDDPWLEGYAGDDTLFGGAGNDELLGDEGSDSLYGGLGQDTLYGGDGSDTLVGGTGADSLQGGDGDDTYYIDAIKDAAWDSAGQDTAYVSTSFVKLPSSLETVIYTDGALALPYWISALLPDQAAGLVFADLLGQAKVFSYTFPSALPSYDTEADHANGYAPFTAVQQAVTVQALAYVSSVIDVAFNPTADAAAASTLSFASNTQVDSAGYALYPSLGFSGSDVFLNVQEDNTTLADGTYGALVLIHEIGHALGLKHPFAQEQSGGGGSAEAPYLLDAEDDTQWTVMSYSDNFAQYAPRYSPLDIAALQYLYGPSKTARATNDTYTVVATASNFVWDGAGVDVLDAQSADQAVTLYLTPGYWGYVGTAPAATISSPGQVTVNFGSEIENVTGSAFGDHLYGNTLTNRITGGLGDDAIDGGAGSDTAVFTKSKAQYSLSATDGGWRITGPDGTDTLTATEYAEFADQTLDLATFVPGDAVTVRAYSWKAHTLLDGVEIAAGNSLETTEALGTATFSGLGGGVTNFTASRSIPAQELAATTAAVNLQDAIAILKMIVGLEVNGASKALSPYQALAADYDGNGLVQLSDAIGVLKHVVGLTSSEPTWHFANALDSTVALNTSLAPGKPPAISATADDSADSQVDLVGYLTGDVDGSFAGRSDASDLDLVDPQYFSTLVASESWLSLAQFGVY